MFFNKHFCFLKDNKFKNFKSVFFKKLKIFKKRNKIKYKFILFKKKKVKNNFIKFNFFFKFLNKFRSIYDKLKFSDTIQ